MKVWFWLGLAALVIVYVGLIVFVHMLFPPVFTGILIVASVIDVIIYVVGASWLYNFLFRRKSK